MMLDAGARDPSKLELADATHIVVAASSVVTANKT
jgi:hypothetical protein